MEEGLTDPRPFSVIVTLVALPPKVLPLIVTGVIRQVVPLFALRFTEGGSVQTFCPDTIIGKLIARTATIKNPETCVFLINFRHK